METSTLNLLAEGRSLKVYTHIVYSAPEIIVQHKARCPAKYFSVAQDPAFQDRVIQLLKIRKILKKDQEYDLQYAAEPFQQAADEGFVIFTALVSKVSGQDIAEFLTLKNRGTAARLEEAAAPKPKKVRKQKPKAPVKTMVPTTANGEKSFPKRGPNIRTVLATKSDKRYGTTAGKKYQLLRMYTSRNGKVWYEVREGSKGKSFQAPRADFLPKGKEDKKVELTTKTRSKTMPKSKKTKKTTDEVEETKTTTRRKKSRKGKAKASAKAKSTKRTSKAKGRTKKSSTKAKGAGRRVPEEYRPESTIGVMHNRLKSGKSVAKVKLFKGLDKDANVESILRRLNRHGKVRGWEIEIGDKTVKMISSGRRSKKASKRKAA